VHGRDRSPGIKREFERIFGAVPATEAPLRSSAGVWRDTHRTIEETLQNDLNAVERYHKNIHADLAAHSISPALVVSYDSAKVSITSLTLQRSNEDRLEEMSNRCKILRQTFRELSTELAAKRIKVTERLREVGSSQTRMHELATIFKMLRHTFHQLQAKFSKLDIHQRPEVPPFF
jgi:hypothetical protein